MAQLKYCYESLQQFCNENSIELCRDYSGEFVRRETKIEGKCKIDGCDELFSKAFRELMKNNSYYCKICINKISDKKRKNTCLQKYGEENPINSEIIQSKMKATNLLKYGTEYSFQSQEIKDKIKKTCIQRFGVENASQNKDIREKYKKTCLEKYGVEHISQTENYKEKYNSTILKKYGVENISQNEEIKNKKKKTCLNNYGVEHPSQSEVIKQKKIDTSLKNYGVEYPNQNSEVLHKIIKSCYRTKEYIFPSGKVVQIQGFEHFALDELIINDKIDESDIIIGSKNVPEIWYVGNDEKNHIHFVDIFIPSQNLCIEVKSDWTAKKNEHNIYLKQNAAKLLGYRYEIWIYNNKGEKIFCYE